MPLYTIDGKLLIVDGMLAESEDCCTCECDPEACTIDGCDPPEFGCCCDPCLTPAEHYHDTPPQLSVEATGISVADDQCCLFSSEEDFRYVTGPGGTIDISAVLDQGAWPDHFEEPCYYYGTASGAGLEFEFFSDEECTESTGTYTGDFQLYYGANGEQGKLFITFGPLEFVVFCTPGPPDFPSEAVTCVKIPDTVNSATAELCTTDGTCNSTNNPVFSGGSAVIDKECA